MRCKYESVKCKRQRQSKLTLILSKVRLFLEFSSPAIFLCFFLPLLGNDLNWPSGAGANLLAHSARVYSSCASVTAVYLPVFVFGGGIN